ncbi:MAG: hypothetical protein AB1649_26020 [Chloroflexota bacterium]
MVTLKHKFPVWIMGAFYIMGSMVALLLWDTEHGKALLTGTSPGGLPWNPIVVVLGTVFDLSIITGWLYLMFGKDQLKPRLHWFWTSFGLLYIAWAWLTVYNTDILERGWKTALLTLVIEPYSITAFGLLLAFYNLDSAKPLWYFCWPYFWVGIVMPFSTTLPSALPPYLSAQYRGEFWRSWGLFLVDADALIFGLIAMFFIIKWRRNILEQEGERHPGFWAFWEGMGLPYVFLWRTIEKLFKR